MWFGTGFFHENAEETHFINMCTGFKLYLNDQNTTNNDTEAFTIPYLDFCLHGTCFFTVTKH
jgi:hypothetical protein